MSGRPVKVTKIRQAHAARPIQKPGRPTFGPNYVAPRAPSAKKTAGRSARSRKATPAR
jgi:hypothetical protein